MSDVIIDAVGRIRPFVARVYGPAVGRALEGMLDASSAGGALVQSIAHGGTAKAPRTLPVPAPIAAALALVALGTVAGLGHLLANTAAGAAATDSIAPAGLATDDSPSPYTPALTMIGRVAIMQLQSTLRSLGALMLLGFRGSASYPVYDNVYGAALASSVIRSARPISPWSAVNAFEQLLPVEVERVLQSTAALQAGRAIVRADPAQDDPYTLAQVAAAWRAIAGGTNFGSA